MAPLESGAVQEIGKNNTPPIYGVLHAARQAFLKYATRQLALRQIGRSI